MSTMAQVEHRFETFSVGIRPDVNNLRRQVFDAIAILAGRRSRLENHTVCFERLIIAMHEMMCQSPGQFAQLFGEGGEFNERRFAAFVKRLMDNPQARFTIGEAGEEEDVNDAR